MYCKSDYDIVQYIPHDRLTESLCNTIFERFSRNKYSSEDHNYRNVTSYRRFIVDHLVKRISELMRTNENAYSKEFIIHILLSYIETQFLVLPEKFITRDFFDELCQKGDKNIKILFVHPQFRQFLTQDFCSYCLINEFVTKDDVPAQFRH